MHAVALIVTFLFNINHFVGFGSLLLLLCSSVFLLTLLPAIGDVVVVVVAAKILFKLLAAELNFVAPKITRNKQRCSSKNHSRHHYNFFVNQTLVILTINEVLRVSSTCLARVGETTVDIHPAKMAAQFCERGSFYTLAITGL